MGIRTPRHHIRPLGRPHDGPDEPENILVLCPNHHTDFDYGRLTVDPKTYRVTHTDEEAVDGTELTIADPHKNSATTISPTTTRSLVVSNAGLLCKMENSH